MMRTSYVGCVKLGRLVKAVENIAFVAPITRNLLTIAKSGDCVVDLCIGGGDHNFRHQLRPANPVDHAPEHRVAANVSHTLAGQARGTHASLDNCNDHAADIFPGVTAVRLRAESFAAKTIFITATASVTGSTVCLRGANTLDEVLHFVKIDLVHFPCRQVDQKSPIGRELRRTSAPACS